MYNEVLEDLTVVKRSGQRVSFNASKVAIAIKKAFDSYGKSDDKAVFEIFEKVLNYINENYKERKTINVEDIQDIIENTLYNEKYYSVYNAFKEYRQKRSLSRKVFAEKQQHKFVKAIEKIEETSLNKDNVMGSYDLLFDFGKIISSEYTKSYILDTKSVRAAEEGNIYIHDLDYFSLGMFPKIHLKLDNKITNIHDVDDLINEIINAGQEIYGEIGINNLDYLIEPFILTRYKVFIIDSLNKYLNVCGFFELINFKKIVEQINAEQTINIDLKNYNQFILNEQLRKIFEKAKEDAYSAITKMCNDVIFNVLMNLEKRASRNNHYTISFGLNDSEVGRIINEHIFNNLSNNIYEKVNIVVKIVDLDMELINHIFKLFKNNNTINIQFVKDGDDLEYFSDGVRVYNNINNSECGSNGRMVVSSTSINLARLGLKHQNKSLDIFYEELANVCELAKNELLLSFETIGSKCKDYYRALFKGNVYDDEKLEDGKKIRKVIKNGVLNIGVIGLKECAYCLEKNETKRKMLINNIIDYLNDKCSGYTKDTKLNFGLYEPVNGRTKLLAIDKAIYGVIPGVTDKKKYDLLNIDLFNDYRELGKIQQKFTSGKLVVVNLFKNLSIKKIADTLENLKLNNVEFVRLEVGKNEY